LGLIPDSGGSWHLPRLVGQARALGLALTGQPISADQAAEWGMIWKSVEDDQLDTEVDSLAAKLAALPPLGLAAIKQITEFNIGHNIIARAIFVGLDNAVREMKKAISHG